MSDYYATLKIQQGRLRQAMANKGIKYSIDLSKKTKSSPASVNALLNFRKSARKKNGDYRSFVYRICEYLNEDPTFLFPEFLDHEVITNKINKFVEKSELQNFQNRQLQPSEDLEKKELTEFLNDSLDSLPEAYSNVIRERYMQDKSVKEIAKENKVCRQRIYEKIEKSLKMLRHPTRKNKLQEFL